MRNPTGLVKFARIAVKVGVVAALGAALGSLFLAKLYVPSSDPILVDARRSDALIAWNNLMALLFSMATVCALFAAAYVRHLGIRERRQRSALVGGSVVAGIAMLVSIVTAELVPWTQVAFDAVETGTHVSGYWVAAFDPDVAFVLTRRGQASQLWYRSEVLLHLAAPFVVAIALWVVSVALRTASPSTGPSAPSVVAPSDG